ncbi:OadG family protein [Romboutsia sp.]|uniref:OadG family protein n=1 Tax=Romboutsia sp. TaxID=1965302 RepID=UPI003F30F104
MNISQLLEALKNTQVNLNIGEKLLTGFSVMILSMVVVFIVLVMIAGIISLLQIEEKAVDKNVETESLNQSILKTKNEDIAELVAVITAGICTATGNSSNNIVVKKIVRSNNSKTSWESMNKK